MTRRNSVHLPDASIIIGHVNKLLKDYPHLDHIIPLDTEHVANAFHLLRFGEIFCELINTFVPEAINVNKVHRDFSSDAKRYFYMIENQTLALRAAFELGCPLTNIGAADLADGNENLLLSMAWQIIKYGLFKRLKESMMAEYQDEFNSSEIMEMVETQLVNFKNGHFDQVEDLHKSKCDISEDDFSNPYCKGSSQHWTVNEATMYYSDEDHTTDLQDFPGKHEDDQTEIHDSIDEPVSDDETISNCFSENLDETPKKCIIATSPVSNESEKIRQYLRSAYSSSSNLIETLRTIYKDISYVAICKNANKSGFARIKDTNGTRWSWRKLVLLDNILFVFRHDSKPISEPLTVFRIDDATIRMLEETKYFGDSIICVNVQHGSCKQFLYLAPENSEVINWRDALVKASNWWVLSKVMPTKII